MKPFFTALNLYHISRPLDLAMLEAQLAELRYQPAAAQAISAMGFVPALGDAASELAHQVGSHILIRVCYEKREIPAAALRREIKAEETKRFDAGERLNKQERDKLRDEVIARLQPRAFSKLIHNRIWIDTRAQTLVVDTCSTHADNCLALLRKALGSLPVVPLSPRQALEVQMTEWLNSGKETIENGGGFCIGQTVAMQGMVAFEQLKSRSEGLAVDCPIVQQALEMRHHVTKLALYWPRAHLSFMLADSGAITQIDMAGEWCELPAVGMDKEEALQVADANFVLATGIMSEFVAAYRALVNDESLPELTPEPITADQVRTLLAKHAEAQDQGEALTYGVVSRATGLGPAGIERLIAEAQASQAHDNSALANWTVSLREPGEASQEQEQQDYLYDKAVAFVGKMRRASTTSLQREFKIGYNRAARLIEKMEAAGLISAAGHNGARDVLMPGERP